MLFIKIFYSEIVDILKRIMGEIELRVFFGRG